MRHDHWYKDEKVDIVDELVEVASDRSSDVMERTLVVATQMLGMEVAFVSKFTNHQMLFRKLSGDADSFGWQEGEEYPSHVPSANG